jgi:hypothetical protein
VGNAGTNEESKSDAILRAMGKTVVLELKEALVQRRCVDGSGKPTPEESGDQRAPKLRGGACWHALVGMR